MRTWEDRPNLLEDLETFVRGIVRNKKRELLRKIRARIEAEVLVADIDLYLPANAFDSGMLQPDAYLIKVDQHFYEIRNEDLYNALMELTEPERTVVLLHFCGRWRLTEIAERQGVTTKTIYNRRSRALAFLRRKLRLTDVKGTLGVDEQYDCRSDERGSSGHPSGP